MKKIALIGSTGSIGVQTLSVVKRHSDCFKIVSLSAGNNEELFLSQVKEFTPKVATIKSLSSKEGLVSFGDETKFYFGENAFTNAIIEEADIVVVALVGFKGIIAVLKAIEMGKDIALANKESLVVGGELVMKLAKEKGVKILPVDSEHSAIWQALDFDFNKPFNKLILTASGGAFRDYAKEELKGVRASDALRHPNWNMGNKITVDCATLVNKAFEVIEAKWLYNAPFSKIDVIIHRESIIHSMVEYIDGSVIAQMSYPTMELPIQLALTYPERKISKVKGLNFAKLNTLTFEDLDREKFPCFDLVVEAGKRGGVYPAVANGANEVAVNLFLQDKIGYEDIYKAIKGALLDSEYQEVETIDDLIKADKKAREYVEKNFGV